MAMNVSQGGGDQATCEVNTTPLIAQAQIRLRPSARARYDVVANVMASAQRNNMTRMGFANISDFAY